MKYFKTTETAEVKSYPYGRLRTKAIFGLEFRRGRGFRTTFQTVNPKTGILNKVKKTTYSPCILMKDDGTGFISYDYFRLYDQETNDKFFNCLHQNFDCFTPEQIEDLALYSLGHIKASFYATLQYNIKPENRDNATEVLKEVYGPNIKTLCTIVKEKTNLFDQINIDYARVKALEDNSKGYNPFKTSLGPVSLMDLARQPEQTTVIK